MSTDSARTKRVAILLLLIAGGVAYISTVRYGQYICEKRWGRTEREVSELLTELDSPRVCVRSQAALDLQKVGRNGAPAVPRLVELLKDKDDSVRWRSVAAIGHIGAWDDRSISAVCSAFDDPNETVRLNTLFALGILPYKLAQDGKGFAARPDDWSMPKEAMQVFLSSYYIPSCLCFFYFV